jgi:hypothetical protein
MVISYRFWRGEERQEASRTDIPRACEKHITLVTFTRTFAILAGDGVGERQEEGTSSCIVPVLSRSNILVCSCDATFSVLTERQIGPKFSSVPMRFRCSCKDINHRYENVRVVQTTVTRPFG